MCKFSLNLIIVQVFGVLVSAVFFTSCGGDSDKKSSTKNDSVDRIENKYYDGIGVGPISDLLLNPDVDNKLVEEGKVIFNAKCTSCHKLSSEKGIGPGLAEVTTRRRPEWVMNMILNPMEMTQKDSMAKELLSIYYSQMLDNNLTVEEARSVLEFLRRY